jgi:hypothetical protein
MRCLTDPQVDQFRNVEWERIAHGGTDNPSHEGCFRVHHRGRWFKVIASTGGGWDHVSVSCEPGRGLPGWYDLEYIKRLFFKGDETAMQLHVPASEHVSMLEVLHLWRPPSIFVGV